MTGADPVKIVTATQGRGHKRAWPKIIKEQKVSNGDLEVSLKIGKQATELVLKRLLHQ